MGLADLYGWGDLSEAGYRAHRRETEVALAAVPAPDDILVFFDQRRAVYASLADDPAFHDEDAAHGVLGVLAPPDGLGGSEAKAVDALSWYALAGRQAGERLDATLDAACPYQVTPS